MISGEFTRKVDVDAEILMTPIRTLYASGDKNAHTFELSLYRNKEPLEIDGAGVIGYFIRADGYTVPVDGTASGSVAKVTLSESCYAVVGQFNLIIKVTVGSERKAVFWGNGYVTRSQTDAIIDPSQTIPSLDELLAQIAATEAAAKAANTAATNANNATKAAQAATTNADTATKAANTAATNANGATKAAQTATTNANTATKAANAAAGKIDNMTVQVSGLEAGAAPTADLSLVDGHYNLSFAIPKGDKGNTGATGATPRITVKVATGEPGTDASVTQGGTAEAPIITLTIPRGDTGSVGTLTINGKTPDAAGKVELTAADVSALGEDAQAKDSAKLAGKAPEYYIQPRNLLDNSEFTNPVNQRGGTSYTAGYTIDRWKCWNTATVQVQSGHISVTGENLYQCFERMSLPNTTVTLAAKKTDGTILIFSSNPCLGVQTSKDNLTIGTDQYVTLISIPPGDYVWAVLYEGTYTAETLPPYVPKGYAVELAECMRYYRVFNVGGVGKGNYIGGVWPITPLLRIDSPTATLIGAIETSNGETTISAGGFDPRMGSIRMDCIVTSSDFNWWKATYEVSADL